MFALCTIIEIDNRIVHKQCRMIIPISERMIVHRLRKCLTEVDPETGALVFIDRDPLATEPINAYVRIDPWGRIQVVIYATETTRTATTLDRRDNDRIGDLEAVDDRHLVDVLAENLRRLMDREGITADALAQLAGIEPRRLAEILDKRHPAAMMDEVCNLAESLGTTADSLIRRSNDQGKAR
jgi:hypothetical protein